MRFGGGGGGACGLEGRARRGVGGPVLGVPCCFRERHRALLEVGCGVGFAWKGDSWILFIVGSLGEEYWRNGATIEGGGL